jgi:hypothetical protein
MLHHRFTLLMWWPLTHLQLVDTKHTCWIELKYLFFSTCYHLVQTDSLKHFHAVCATRLLWQGNKQFLMNSPSVKDLDCMTDACENSELILMVWSLKSVKNFVGLSVSELGKLVCVFWIFQNMLENLEEILKFIFKKISATCTLSAGLHFIYLAQVHGVSERTLQWYAKCYYVASVTKTFTLKGVQTIHRSRCWRHRRPVASGSNRPGASIQLED